MKHIGIVAVSTEGAALCYRTICLEGAALLGPHAHPEVSLHNFPLSEYQRLIDRDEWPEVGAMLLESATRLVRAGAQILICPDNTIHQGLDLVRERSPAPWIHIAEEVTREAAQRQFKRVGILGTRFLMEGPVYPSQAHAGRHRIQDAERRPARAYQSDHLRRAGARHNSCPSRANTFSRSLRDLASDGCDAVALACTEIPLLIDETASPLPILDSTRIIARAALRAATQ